MRSLAKVQARGARRAWGVFITQYQRSNTQRYVSLLALLSFGAVQAGCAGDPTATTTFAGAEPGVEQGSVATSDTSGSGGSDVSRSSSERPTTESVATSPVDTTAIANTTRDDVSPTLVKTDALDAGSTNASSGAPSIAVGDAAIDTTEDSWSPGEDASGQVDAGGPTSPTDDASTTSESSDSGVSTDEVVSDALYVAPNGEQGASGTIDAPTTLASAVARVGAGQTIYLRAGAYFLSSTLSLSASGSDESKVGLRAYPLDDGRPRLDFSLMAEDSGNRGLSLSGDYWHVYGIDVFKAGDNCMFVSGENNIIEFSTFSECADTGLQLGNGAANNLVLNCDSFFNADSSLENADGFAAKLDVGTGNRFVGCRAWNNLDDGWDGYLRPADDITTSYENCWAIDNGKLENGSEGAGDGNGFKTGGSDDKDLSHNAIYQGCIAAGNVNDGFDHNSNRGNITILNSAAHDNGTNINFSSSNIAASLTIKNTLTIGEEGSLNATTTDFAGNSWPGAKATEEDFESLDIGLLKSARNDDGSLPSIEYLRLVAGSDLRNAGVDVGAPFAGSAPDIGPFESAE